MKNPADTLTDVARFEADCVVAVGSNPTADPEDSKVIWFPTWRCRQPEATLQTVAEWMKRRVTVDWHKRRRRA